MSDSSVAAHIEQLVAEEHALQRKEEADRSDGQDLAADQERLEAVRVELDRCWDLLRQRRAIAAAGGDPDQAHVRDASVVESYLQ